MHGQTDDGGGADAEIARHALKGELVTLRKSQVNGCCVPWTLGRCGADARHGRLWDCITNVLQCVPRATILFEAKDLCCKRCLL